VGLRRAAPVLGLELARLPLPGQEPQRVLDPRLLRLGDVGAGVVGLDDLGRRDLLGGIGFQLPPRRLGQQVQIVAGGGVAGGAQVLAVRVVDDVDVGFALGPGYEVAVRARLDVGDHLGHRPRGPGFVGAVQERGHALAVPHDVGDEPGCHPIHSMDARG